MREVASRDALRRDPIRALAVSASGRENFPADAQGNPLGNGLMGADVRGAEFEALPQGQSAPEAWSLCSGHARERMDPVFRLAWWKKYRPEIMEKARRFFGWIDYLIFRMTGRAVMDLATASRYAVFDLASGTWNSERVRAFEIEAGFLPELLPWGAVVGPMTREVAEEWGLPQGVIVAQGGHDVNCAAVGAGVWESGNACLVSGSYENLVVVTDRFPTVPMLLRGLSVTPHPGRAARSVIAIHPTGSAVLNWARKLLGVEIPEIDSFLANLRGPSPVLAVPHLSGAMAYWENGRRSCGGVLNLTLSTSAPEIVQAFMESIAYDTRNTLALLRREGVDLRRIRLTGGGARSAWWTQLKADVTGVPVEVASRAEPGTLGAALLAGVATGAYRDLAEATRVTAEGSRVFEPDAARASLHSGRMDEYHAAIAGLLRTIWTNDSP
ncbi:MAG TPA: FGGY family carbohydrate kinase, partial [Planctomycetota bacterium]|nr:FGGY family carbohydrate kinase [Planctomycetota bacterium]